MHLNKLVRSFKTINPDLAEALTTLFMLKYGKNKFDIPTLNEYKIFKMNNNNQINITNKFPDLFEENKNHFELIIPKNDWYDDKAKPKKPKNKKLLSQSNYDDQLKKFEESKEKYDKVVLNIFQQARNIYHIHYNLGKQSNHFINITNIRVKPKINENDYIKEASIQWLTTSLQLDNRKSQIEIDFKSFEESEDSIIHCCVAISSVSYTFEDLRTEIEKEINPDSNNNNKYEYIRLYINNALGERNDEFFKDNVNDLISQYKNDFTLWKNKGLINGTINNNYSKTDLQFIMPYAISNILEKGFLIYHAFPHYKPTLELGNRISQTKIIHDKELIILWEYNGNYGNTVKCQKITQQRNRKRKLDCIFNDTNENKSNSNHDNEILLDNTIDNIENEYSISHQNKRHKSNNYVQIQTRKNIDSIVYVGNRLTSEQWFNKRNRNINYNSHKLFRLILCICMMNYSHNWNKLDNKYPFRSLYQKFIHFDNNNKKSSATMFIKRLLNNYNYIIQKNQKKSWIKIQLNQLKKILSSIITFNGKITESYIYHKNKLIKESEIHKKLLATKLGIIQTFELKKFPYIFCANCNSNKTKFRTCVNRKYVLCGTCDRLIMVVNEEE